MAVSTTAMAALGLVIAVGVLLSNLLRPKMDPREPPVVHPKVPFVGHLIGMFTEGPLYFTRISKQCKHPIFTLPILSGKTYLVVDPVLAVAVQRASATLDFDEIVTAATPHLVKLNAQSTRILRDRTAKQEGRRRLVSQLHTVINPPLAAHNMENISKIQLQHFSNHINKFKDGEVGLYHFFTRELVAATMCSMYGPENPFSVHPHLVEKFWEWDDGNVGYAASPCPQITARKAHKAMEECLQGWVEYTEKGRYSQAQPFLQTRFRMNMEVGISIQEHARLEMGICLGFNSNASVTTFWVLNNIFSRPQLLQELREEIYTNAFEAPATISATKIKASCPLLNSVFRESLRLAAPMPSARVVLQDTVIADTYLLKKGNVVQIAGGAMNSDPDIWGPDALSFNPLRFLHSPSGTKTTADGTVAPHKSNAVHPAAFRCFGGGTSLCPGRHFAQMEVTALAALMVLGFEMSPVAGKEAVEWDPERDDTRFPLVVVKPKRDVGVVMGRRRGWEDVVWELRV